MPTYAKAAGTVSLTLIAPFFLMYFYYHISLFLQYRFQMFSRPDFEPASIYSGILPTIGLAVIATTASWWLYKGVWSTSLHTLKNVSHKFIADGLVFYLWYG